MFLFFGFPSGHCTLVKTFPSLLVFRFLLAITEQNIADQVTVRR